VRVIGLETTASVDAHESRGLTVGPVAGSEHASCTLLRLDPGGVVGRHQAPTGQLLVVLEGAAEVTGGEGESHRVGAGGAVWWDAGEEHETWSEGGLLALTVEGLDLELLGS